MRRERLRTGWLQANPAHRQVEVQQQRKPGPRELAGRPWPD